MSSQILIKHMIKEIQQVSIKDIHIMEVCGTHTEAISKLGIRELVKSKISLLSGPGCPVCVTAEAYMDAAIELVQQSNVIVTTFGDMMRVKGSRETLTEQKEKGKDIRVVYSPLDSIALAKENKDKEIVFLAVGFETTTPLIALAIKAAEEDSIKNISFLIGMKKMEPILHHILSDKHHNIQGLICPGHVAAVRGEDYFKFIVEQFNIPAVIAGFGALDIISALYFLMQQQGEDKKTFKNFYKSCVTVQGNKRANELMEEVFTDCMGQWRGIGNIKASGFLLREKYKNYDAAKRFGVKIAQKAVKTCICSEVLLGKKLPNSCEFFGKVCTPEQAVGPCMVSSEGVCSIYYKYKRGGINE